MAESGSNAMTPNDLHSQVTICITMGRRPDLLKQTLASLGPLLKQLPVLAINDFRDTPTNEAFAVCCPHGRLLEPGKHLGHHGAVDFMYAQVKTPYILHLEDDWHFDQLDFLPAALALLKAEAKVSQVCLRDISDFPAGVIAADRLHHAQTQGLAWLGLTNVHPQWYGWSFNPHVSRREDVQRWAPFTRFKKERHISRWLRAEGYQTAYLHLGPCRHIGEHDSVSVPNVPLFKRFKTWLRGK